MKESVVLTRGQVGRAASVVGGAALVIAAALVALQGEVTPLGLAALIVGMAGIVLWIALAPEDFRDWIAGRQARYGGGSLLGTFLFIGVVLLIYGWVAGQGLVLDMTLSQNFTLGPQTRDLLAALDRPVQITGFYSSASLAQRETDGVIFHLFEAESGGRVRVVYVDPVLQPEQADRFGVQGDGVAVLTFVDPITGSPDLTRIEPIDLSDAQERAVANALLRLLAAGQYRVYFTTGHGEIDPQDTSRQGLSGLYAHLPQSGIQTATLDLAQLGGGGIPEDADAVIVAGAQRRFTQAEADAVAAYLDRGGNLFVAAEQPQPDATFYDADDPLRAYLEAHFGLRVLDAAVVDEASSFQSAFNVVSPILAYHPITENLGDTLTVVFLGSRPVEAVPYENQPESLVNVGRAAIVFTSESAYAETDLRALWTDGTYARDAADPSGQLGLAAVAEHTETGARALLTGDADWLRNEPAGYSGNLIFFDQAVGWLTYFSEEVETEIVSDLTRMPLALPDYALTNIFIGVVIVLPGLVLLTGFIVWNRRQRR